MSKDRFIGKDGRQTSYESIIRQNEQTVSASLTIDATNNAMSAGPITIDTSTTVTVNGYWSIV
tara:strand:+ start:1254 stop:1442 length:189 start_codon:yes stop_codon:yes gene_type:complete